ncbi:MAG: LysR substrate-binding domain-containing protein, partial [Polyangiales bacterium]
METLANLECFVRSAEERSFSAAARKLGLTPAAVSRNVAMLERNLGTRLFQRSTRKLALTEAGEAFLQQVAGNLHGLQTAIADASQRREQPAGVLKVSMPFNFGIPYLLPELPRFLAKYPQIRPDFRFESRQVDLIAEGIDVAIGGAIELSSGVVARALGPAHLYAVASPTYMRERKPPRDPAALAVLDGIVMRTQRTGRIRQWTLRNSAGRELAAPLRESIVFNEPSAILEATLGGLGVSMLATLDVAAHLQSGALVRLLP